MAGTTERTNRFVEWCNQELRSRGWSQKELADRSGVDTGYLSRILKREKELTFDTGAKLATGFGLESPVPLFVIAELIPPHWPKMNQRCSMRKTVNQFVFERNVRRLTPDQQSRLLATALAMLAIRNQRQASRIETDEAGRRWEIWDPTHPLLDAAE